MAKKGEKFKGNSKKKLSGKSENVLWKWTKHLSEYVERKFRMELKPLISSRQVNIQLTLLAC